jgi:hypothetical protein
MAVDRDGVSEAVVRAGGLVEILDFGVQIEQRRIAQAVHVPRDHFRDQEGRRRHRRDKIEKPTKPATPGASLRVVVGWMCFGVHLLHQISALGPRVSAADLPLRIADSHSDSRLPDHCDVKLTKTTVVDYSPPG